ncbi:SCF ubiquitin ligase complex subunit cdc4 [Ascosphaera aggregata]|nr:SCF ubiquitin ligase complex subunit cdc4 [Ascosphaera aggregata]
MALSSQHSSSASNVTVVSNSRKRKATWTPLTAPGTLKRRFTSASRGGDDGEVAGSVPSQIDLSISGNARAAANAAAMAVPYPHMGMPSLQNLHLYKSLYHRHYRIQQAWMQRDSKPLHLAFRAHTHHVVTCLQFDSEKILTGSDDTNINVYDTKTGALRTTLRGHEGGVWALEYVGNTLVSGSTDRSVRVWDIERAECTQVFQGHTSTVRCLQILQPVKVGEGPDGGAEYVPKEPLIITGSRDSTLRVWKLPGRNDPKFYQTGPAQDEYSSSYFVRTLTGHQHSVRALAAYGDTLVSGSYDTTVRVWKISTGQCLHRLQGHHMKVYSVVLDHERERCISGSMDHMVKIWCLKTGAALFTLEGHHSLVGLLDLRANRLVSAAADSTLRIWDPENGRCRSILTAHTGAITCFQHDQTKVISGSDRTLKMWDVRTGEFVKDVLSGLNGVWQVKFDDRRCVAAVQRDRLTYIEVRLEADDDDTMQVIDYGAARDGCPDEHLGRRIVVNPSGEEVDDPNITFPREEV